MKINNKLLKEELDKTKELMENIFYVNSKDLKNWSANQNIKTAQGLTSYIKNGYDLIQKDNAPESRGTRSWSYSSKDLVYTTPDKADELNQIGSQIRELVKQYNEKYDQYVTP